MTATVNALAVCIGCGCDDFHSCSSTWREFSPSGCWWLRVDRADGKGVCSECLEHVEAWDRGDRTPHAQPIVEIEDQALSRVPRSEQPRLSEACGLNHDWPFVDVQDGDRCRWCGMSFVRHVFTEMP